MFNIFKSGEKVDYKARLERKLVLARDDPEPLFDLIDCNLKSVPKGVFSLCKVLRKESLLLQNNAITSLSSSGNFADLFTVKILDISFNQIAKLPEEIGALVNLEVLRLSNNKISYLPDSIGKLFNLRILDASNNKLRKLPSSLCFCENLEELNLLGNKPLESIPPDFRSLLKLKQLLIDKHVSCSFYNPDADLSPMTSKKTVPSTSACLKNESSSIEERLMYYELQKEREKKERIAVELALAEESRKELELHLDSKQRNLKLVQDIKLKESDLDGELSKIQRQNELQRSRFLEGVLQEEEFVNFRVSALLGHAKKNQEILLKQAEYDKMMEDQLLTDIYAKSHTIERASVIESMTKLVKDEFKSEEKFRRYQEERDAAGKVVMSEENKYANKLGELVAKSYGDSKKLKEDLIADEEMQKAAVAALMEQSDARSWQLANEVAAVEKQLAELTRLELARKKLEIDGHIIELSKSRIALTEHLMDLLTQQQIRRSQLVSVLRRLEESQNGSEYWLAQYQRLMDSASRNMVDSLRAVDSRLTEVLTEFGLSHYLPVLVTKLGSRDDIAGCSDMDLFQVGVSDEGDRKLILKALSTYLTTSVPESPSAPPEEHLPSAPPMSPTIDFTPIVTDDCVVCLESTVDTIFVPCGHMCCCQECCVGMKLCPLCRGEIEGKIMRAP